MENEEEKIYVLKGNPKQNNRKELSFFKTFLQWAKGKFILGNEYLEARVEKEKAQAFKEKAQGINEYSQAAKNIAEAKEIALRVDQKDEEFDAEKLPNRSDALNNLLKDLEDEIKFLSLTKGTTISFGIDEGEKISLKEKKE